MTTYRIGDHVVIRSDLQYGNYYGGIYFNDSMERLCGQEHVIRRVADCELSSEGVVYELDDVHCWVFSREMLLPAITDQMDDFEVDLKEVLVGLYV